MRNWILLALAAVFTTLFLVIVGTLFYLPGPAIAALAAAFLLLGLALVILTVRGDETGARRFLLVLTGACAAAMPVTAILHNFGFHAFLFIVTLLILPVIFVVALVTSVILLAIAEKPVSRNSRLLVGGVFALVLAAILPVALTMHGAEGYEVTSQVIDTPPEGPDRVFVIAEVDEALMHVVYHSFEHSLVSALESNGIAAKVALISEESDEAAALAAERQSFSPDATMHIRMEPLYRTHRDGFEAIVGTVFSASLKHAESGQEWWQLSGKVDYVTARFFDSPGYATSYGMKQEFAWHTTAAIVRTFMVDVMGRESEPIYTVTEERQQKGQRAD